MLRVFEATNKIEMGQNRAALEYGVPPTTLKDRFSGRVVHGTNIGTKPYLTNEKEKEHMDFYIICLKMGYGKSNKKLNGWQRKKRRSVKSRKERQRRPSDRRKQMTNRRKQMKELSSQRKKAG